MWRDHITVYPAVERGRERIRGTGVRVADVLASLAAGGSIEELARTYPGLTPEAIRAVQAYAADLVGQAKDPAVARYEGIGRLRFTEGFEDQCAFEAFQISDGSVFLHVRPGPAARKACLEGKPVADLVGTTVDGWNIDVTGVSFAMYIPLMGDQPVVYRAERLVVAAPTNAKARRSNFRVVNLILGCPHLPIMHPSGQAFIRTVPGYQNVARHLKRSRGIDITSELVVEAPDANPTEVLAEDVCLLLSLAQGNKIQWITREDYAESDSVVRRYHYSHVTKSFFPQPTIDYRDVQDTRRFLELAMPTYLERKDLWRLSDGLIDAYLDVRSGMDYLQSRGTKLAVVMEMVKEAYLSTPGARPDVMKKSEFKKIQKGLKKFLDEKSQEFGLVEEECKYLKENLTGLNRIPFKSVLGELCSKLARKVPEEDVRFFVRCRDSLVHTGRFYCESSKAEAQDHRHLNPIEEYCWLLHFIDRMLLRVVGYRGPYIDWSNPGSPRRAEL